LVFFATIGAFSVFVAAGAGLLAGGAANAGAVASVITAAIINDLKLDIFSSSLQKLF